MAEHRELVDSAGTRWSAEVITTGRTSGYLNPRVHRPIVQFTCLDERRPRKYASLSEGDPSSLLQLDAEELRALLGRARSH